MGDAACLVGQGNGRRGQQGVIAAVSGQRTITINLDNSGQVGVAVSNGVVDVVSITEAGQGFCLSGSGGISQGDAIRAFDHCLVGRQVLSSVRQAVADCRVTDVSIKKLCGLLDGDIAGGGYGAGVGNHIVN